MNGHTMKKKIMRNTKKKKKFDPDMTEMLELADNNFKMVMINIFKDLKDKMGIINKQMGNLIREMDKLTVDEIWQGKKTLVNLKTGQ